MGMLEHGSEIRAVRKGLVKLYIVMQGLLKRGTAGEGESWWNGLVWPIPNGELEGMRSDWLYGRHLGYGD